MHFFNRSHLSDDTLLRSLTTHVAEGRTNDAHVLADLAEVELRKLYAARGYSSMFAYCVGELGFCEQAAYKRLSAARAAQKHHAILGAVADGRLHRSAVVLLAPHLTSENAEELIRAATHRTKAQIEQLLAERFPRPDVVTLVRRLPERATQEEQLSPGDSCSPLGSWVGSHRGFE